MGQVVTKVMGPPPVEDPQDFLVERRGVVWNVDGTMKSCMFCDFTDADGATEREEKRTLLFEDELVAAFAPEKEAAKQHILVVPKRHVTAVGDLFSSDVQVLTRIRDVAEELLKKREPSLTEENMQFSFHVPPWNSVDHLHVHAIEKPFNSKWDRVKFAEGKPWCASFDKVYQWVSTSPDIKDEDHYSPRATPLPQGLSTPADEHKEPLPSVDNDPSVGTEEKEEQPQLEAEEQA